MEGLVYQVGPHVATSHAIGHTLLVCGTGKASAMIDTQALVSQLWSFSTKHHKQRI